MVTGSFLYPRQSANLRQPYIIRINHDFWMRKPSVGFLIRYFSIVCQIDEHNKCLLSSNYSSEKQYKEKRMRRTEGTTTKAILLGTTSRDDAYIKVIVIRQTEYKASPEKLSDSCNQLSFFIIIMQLFIKKVAFCLP